MALKKYFICDIKKIRECTCCGEIKPFTEFHKNPSDPRGIRPNCMLCHTGRNARFQAEKLLALYPKKYAECSSDECGHIWAKHPECRRYQNVDRSKCPKCGAEPDNFNLDGDL